MNDADDLDDAPRLFSFAAACRVLIGIGGIVGLGWQYNRAQDDLHKAQQAIGSDTQFTELFWSLWVPHIFYAIIIIGMVISLYVVTRWSD